MGDGQIGVYAHACDATKGAFNRRYIEKWATFKQGLRLPTDDEDGAVDSDSDDGCSFEFG